MNINEDHDILSEVERHVRMSRVRHEDTDLETIVRKFLFNEGFRYRKNDKRYAGSPDIILPKYHTAIFVHGCFWHGHPECKAGRLPKTRHEFWAKKISENVERDSRFIKLLEQDGWKVFVVWGCELKNAKKRNQRLKKLIKEIVANKVISIEHIT